MPTKHLNLLLADDDPDDCIFFKQALDGLPRSTKLTAVHDGEQLMALLNNESTILPDVLFLDLNMPRKSGFECLSEIKLYERLKEMPVIIFSTSFEQEVVSVLYTNGVQYFIRKPAEFSQLREVIEKALNLISKDHRSQPSREEFVLCGPKLV